MEVIAQETVTAGIARYTREQQRRATTAMMRGANEVKNAAQRRLVFRTSKAGPGGRSDGTLARSIAARLEKSTPTEISAVVAPGVSYARYVEGYPTPPRRHFLPFAVAPDLMRWLDKHGIIVPAKAKGWMVGGPQSSTPYLRPAADEVIPKLLPKMAQALRV